MKKTIGVLAIYATLGLIAAPFANLMELRAQTPSPTPAAAAPAQGTCTEEAKAPLYAEFMAARTTDTPKAYAAAKKYLAICTQDDQYTSYLKKWSTAFEKEDRKAKFQALLYGDKKYTEAFEWGKQILADDPENLRVMIDLGYAGFHLAAPTTKSEAFNADSLNYSRKAIQMIEAGKAPTSLDGKAAPWNPFKGKEDSLAYLYHGVGRMTLKTNPEEALAALIKALQYETDLKKEAWEYYFVAAAYETGPYPKLSEDYKKYTNKEETPESKLALVNIHQVIDRMIDAYARAVALAGNDPKYAAPKKEWMEGLSTWYKFRHEQSVAGLTDLIASVMSKPLPPVPTPITTLPETAPATSTTPAAPGTGAGSTAAAKPATTPASAPATTSAATPATTTPKATPKPTPQPKNNHSKPKPKRRH